MSGRIILDIANPALDSSGAIDTGSTLTFYQNGTVTPQAVYTDPTLATALSNPLSCDSAGRFPEVWAPSGSVYSVKWSFTSDPPITLDNIWPLEGIDAGKIVYASGYATLAAADAAAGSAGVVVLDPNAAFTLSTAATLSAARYVALGGTITRGSNAVTFSNAAPFQEDAVVFDAAGSGLVTFGGGRAGVVYAQSFGAKGDGLTASGNALQQAHNCVAAFPEGGTVITPAGTTSIDTQVVFNGTIGTTFGNKNFELRGKSGNSILRSTITGSPGPAMLWFGDNVGHSVSYGISVRDLTLESAATPGSGGELWLAYFASCIDVHMENVNFYGGSVGQMFIGRPQGFRYINGRMVGFFDTVNKLYMTQYGLVLGPDTGSAQPAGQDSYFENITIRDFRTPTHSAVGLQLQSGGGSEHRFIACEIENCDLMVDVKQNSVSFVSGSTETRGAYMTVVPAGTNNPAGSLTLNRLNSSSAVYFGGSAAIEFPPSGSSANIISTPAYLTPAPYTVTMTSATTFNVFDPTGAPLVPPSGTVGTAYVSNIAFTVNGTPNATDSWTIPVAGDTTFLIGASGGTAISYFRALDMNMSMSGLTNGLYFDFETFKQFQVLYSDFDVVAGTAIYVASEPPSTEGLRSDIVGNRVIDSVANIVLSSGADGRVRIEDNIGSADLTPERIVLPDGAATPNTANARTVVTNNSAATTITQFLGGYIGKQMMVVIGDSNTTIQHGTNIFLRSGLTTKCNNGDTLLFVAQDGSSSTSTITWQQVALASATSPKLGTRQYTTDAALTLTPGTDVQTQIINVSPTAAHNITPSLTNAIDGETRFDILLKAAPSAGKFWQVRNSAGTTLKELTVPGQMASIVYSASVGDFVLLETDTWQRLGTNVITTDAAFTLTPVSNYQNQVINVAATSAHNIALSTTGAIDGVTRFEIACIVAPAGGSWLVKNAAGTLLKTLTAAGQGAIVVYSLGLGDYFLVE
jgi:hypothetical protein